MRSVYLIHNTDNTLSLLWSNERPNAVAWGGFGSYRSLLSAYMSFTPRLDRQRIITANDDQLMECIDAVTSIIGRKAKIRLTGGVAHWFIDLIVGDSLVVLHLQLDANKIVRPSLRAFLIEEGYEVI